MIQCIEFKAKNVLLYSIKKIEVKARMRCFVWIKMITLLCIGLEEKKVPLWRTSGTIRMPKRISNTGKSYAFMQ